MSRRLTLSDHEVRLIRLEREIMKAPIEHLAAQYRVTAKTILEVLDRAHVIDLDIQPDILQQQVTDRPIEGTG